jgi:hypothetical protein
MKRHIIFGVLAFLACAIFLLSPMNWWRHRGTAMRQASLIFHGFTNVPAKGDRAIFSLTNDSTKTICFLVDSFDTLSSGSWEAHRLDTGDGKGTLTAEATQWLLGFIGTPNRLSPHQGKVFYVPAPVTNVAWRVRFLCVEETLGDTVRNHTTQITTLPTNAVTSGNGEWFTGRHYKILSTEISK